MEKSSEPFLFRARSLTSSFRNKLQIIFLTIATLLIVGLYFKNHNDSGNQNLQVQGDSSSFTPIISSDVIVDVEGSVIYPGVYKLSPDKKVEDALIMSGGLSKNADRIWVDENLDRAAKLTDKQKIYIPSNKQ